jgi:hypothetical protein
MELNQKAKDLATEITDYVNRGGRDCGKELAVALSREHRTLQQSTMKMFLEFIELAASDEYMTDGRNEDTKKMSKRLIQGFVQTIAKERDLPESEILKNWDVYKPSRWLPLI